jgi:hypothetical protein
MDYLNQQSATGLTDSHGENTPIEPKWPKLKGEEKRLKRPLSKRSGGPNTPEGKSKSAQNSIKHGGYALVPRSREEYVRLEQQVYGHLKPIGAVEEQLVSRIAFTLWRTGLIQRYVDEAHDAVETDEISHLQLACSLDFPFEARYQYLLNVNDSEAVRQRRLAKFWATSCDDLSRADSVTNLIAAGDERIREIYREGIDILGQTFVHQAMHEKFFYALDRVMYEARECRNSLGIKLSGSDDLTELVNYWIYRNSLKIAAARRQIREEQALRILCDPKIERALAGLDSALQRQLDVYWAIKEKDIETGRELQTRLLII